jgi:hypothetical protein
MNLNVIHEIHMSLSYDKSDKIYQYIENVVNENDGKTFTIDTRLVIGTNRLNCIDTCLLFLSDDVNIRVTKQKISYYICKMNSNKIDKFKNLWSIQTLDNNLKSSSRLLKQALTNESKKVCDHVREEYSKILSGNFDFEYVVSWVYDIISTLKTLIHMPCDYDYDSSAGNLWSNSDSRKTYLEKLKSSSSIGHMFLNENKEIEDSNDDGYGCFLVKNYGEIFVGIYHFLSNLEWFHVLITLIMCEKQFESKSLSRKYSLIFGEKNLIEYEYIHTYSLIELKTLFTQDYMSHSVLYVIGKDILYVYDPDGSDDFDDNKFNPLKMLNYIIDFPLIKSSNLSSNNICDLNIDKLEFIEICEKCITKSIQTVTNDQYCIFHCIWFVLKLVKILNHIMNRKNFIQFLKYVNKINDVTTIDDVRFFICELKEKSILYEKNQESQIKESQNQELQIEESQNQELQIEESQNQELQIEESQNQELQIEESQNQELQIEESQIKESQIEELQIEELQNQELQNQESQIKELQIEELQIQELQNYKSQNQESQNQESQNQELQNQELQTEELQNQELQNQELQTEELQNQELQNQELQTEELQNQELQNQELQTEELQNQELQNQELQNQELQTEKSQIKELQNQELQIEESQIKELQIEELQTEELQNQELQTEELQTEELQTKELQTEELQNQELQTEKLQNQELQIKEL